jgi:hypothetical protein
MIDEPYLVGMRKMVKIFGWKLDMSSFHKDKPDAFMTNLYPFILEKRKTPTPKTRIFAMLLQHSSFYFFSDFPMSFMWCRRAILVCMMFIIAG